MKRFPKFVLWFATLPLLSAAHCSPQAVRKAMYLSGAGTAREQVLKVVTQIQRADYEGDRLALKRLHGELAPFVENKELASRVLYWRGFALWRRAINGFQRNLRRQMTWKMT